MCSLNILTFIEIVFAFHQLFLKGMCAPAARFNAIDVETDNLE